MLTQTLYTPPIEPKDVACLASMKRQIREANGVGQMAWVMAPQQFDDVADIMRLARQFRGHCDHVVVCGTGGSSLGAKTLIDLVNNPLGLVPKNAPQLHVCESTDAESLEALFALPPERTGWIFISKSGSTLETLAQFLAYIDYRSTHKNCGPSLAITMPGARPLRQLAEQYDIPLYDHAPDLGGRFSVFSIVGLLPAAIAGLDITALRQGAVSLLEQGLDMAAEAAAWQVACMRNGHSTQIMMPYAKRLSNWTLWYRQLWAESLGKEGKGSTPLAAMGPVDHHSMLQLFLDGPMDKSVTMVTIEEKPSATHLHVPEALKEYEFLNAHSPQAIINAQAYGTMQSFLRHDIPLRHIQLKLLDEYTLGELLMLGMLETVFTAALLQVDAFDQPAVEESKLIAFECLKSAKSADLLH